LTRATLILDDQRSMANQNPNVVVSASTTGTKLADGVIGLDAFDNPMVAEGCRVFTHYNGPTDQLSGLCVGMCVLDPGSSPHPPHQHAEEEFMIVASGTGQIECAGKTTPVGPGSVMYCAGNVMHGITNTGKVPLTFYWSKWLAKGA
jgi:mannose-6-phosphate isomerase-like protein (cupin superfamily)